LKQVAATVRFQCAGLQDYISRAKEKDPLIEAVWKHQEITGYKSVKKRNGRIGNRDHNKMDQEAVTWTAQTTIT